LLLVTQLKKKQPRKQRKVKNERNIHY